MMDTIYYSQSEFNDDMANLCEMLEGDPFDLIIGVNRGGCLPAVCLSHHLKIPATMIDWSTRDGANISPLDINEYFKTISTTFNKVLIVDDLIDSGISMEVLLETATKHCDVSVATLLHNIDVELNVPHYSSTKFSRKEEPRYFDFWWEVI